MFFGVSWPTWKRLDNEAIKIGEGFNCTGIDQSFDTRNSFGDDGVFFLP